MTHRNGETEQDMAPHALERLARAVASAATTSQDTGRRRRFGGRARKLPRQRPVAIRRARRDVSASAMRDRAQLGEVIRIDEAAVTVKPFDVIGSVGLGAVAWRHGFVRLRPHRAWKGRILNALGVPIDEGEALPQGDVAVSVDRVPPAPMRRQRVRNPVRTGVRVIDLFTPICAGQRIGIFAGSGIGKSTLLAMLARSRGFDTVVVALVGERGREVREFIEDVARRRNRARAVAVVATGDESPMMRRHGAENRHVRCRVFPRPRRERSAHRRFGDPLRACRARRGACRRRASGRPRLSAERAERSAQAAGAGRARRGRSADRSPASSRCWSTATITTIRSPTAMRGTLDGHIVLDRAIADQGRYPAVNVLGSISRLAKRCGRAEQAQLIAQAPRHDRPLRGYARSPP